MQPFGLEVPTASPSRPEDLPAVGAGFEMPWHMRFEDDGRDLAVLEAERDAAAADEPLDRQRDADLLREFTAGGLLVALAAVAAAGRYAQAFPIGFLDDQDIVATAEDDAGAMTVRRHEPPPDELCSMRTAKGETEQRIEP